MVDIPRTFGALLVGGLVATAFSGVVTVQCLAYFKFFPHDPLKIRLLVSSVWFLDICHTIFVSMSLWDHLIDHFGDAARIDFVPWSMALTIAFTAILTFLVHCFFVQRIYKLSMNNCLIAVPLGILAALRLGFACLTTVKLITLRNFSIFVQQYNWSFTSGLALSSAIDIFITASLCYLFMHGRRQNSNLNHVLDSLILYAFENGSLTCASTIVSMLCWLLMPTNLIFMALHFVISKFYATSLLATLNTRKGLKEAHSLRSHPENGGHAVPVLLHHATETRPTSKRFSKFGTGKLQMEINIEKTTIRTVDESCVTTLHI